MVFRRIATMTTPTNPVVRKQHVSRLDTFEVIQAHHSLPVWRLSLVVLLFFSTLILLFLRNKLTIVNFFYCLVHVQRKFYRISTLYFGEELGYVVCRSIYSRLWYHILRWKVISNELDAKGKFVRFIIHDLLFISCTYHDLCRVIVKFDREKWVNNNSKIGLLKILVL